ncbi:MAG: DUF4097 family beta strand repeat protein [Acidobacteria bacterium]|nr:DUF4097 family beta strand repeat protein [Acidobacteriota bacterium]
MQLRLKALVLTAAAVLMAACDWDDFGGFGNAQAYKEEFHQTHALKAGGRVALENFNGSIEIRGWDQDTVDISGTKYGSTPELRDSIKIEVSASPDTVRIRTVRPGERRGNCGARYVLRVPRKVELDSISSSNGSIRVEEIEGLARLRTSNGGINTANIHGTLDVTTSNGGVEVRDTEGPVSVRTSNGRVRAEGVRGAFDASTTNGSIQARLEKSDPHRPVRLETSNGSIDLRMEEAVQDVRATTTNGGITLRLPGSLSARVRARTSNSSISTEFDVRQEGANSKHRLEGAIGAGGPTLDLTTSNGGIKLLRL